MDLTPVPQLPKLHGIKFSLLGSRVSSIGSNWAFILALGHPLDYSLDHQAHHSIGFSTGMPGTSVNYISGLPGVFMAFQAHHCYPLDYPFGYKELQC